MSDVQIPHRANPAPSPEDPELHVGDFIVVVESDPFYVGDHPVVSAAAREGTLGRVLRKQWKVLTPKEAAAFGKTAEYEIAVRFEGAPKTFFFWACCVRKVRDTGIARPGS